MVALVEAVVEVVEVVVVVGCGNGATSGDTFLMWTASSSEMLISTGCHPPAPGTVEQGHPGSFLTPSSA